MAARGGPSQCSATAASEALCKFVARTPSIKPTIAHPPSTILPARSSVRSPAPLSGPPTAACTRLTGYSGPPAAARHGLQWQQAATTTDCGHSAAGCGGPGWRLEGFKARWQGCRSGGGGASTGAAGLVQGGHPEAAGRAGVRARWRHVSPWAGVSHAACLSLLPTRALVPPTVCTGGGAVHGDQGGTGAGNEEQQDAAATGVDRRYPGVLLSPCPCAHAPPPRPGPGQPRPAKRAPSAAALGDAGGRVVGSGSRQTWASKREPDD